MDDAKTPNYPPPPSRALVVQREVEVWRLRCRGWTLQRIGDHLALSAEGVRKIEARVAERESRRLAKGVHRVKARQNGQLEHIIEEEFDAWHKSKDPRTRVVEKTNPDGEVVKTVEAVEGLGDSRHLQVAMQAQGAQRELLGLNIMAAPYPAAHVSDVTLQMAERGQKFERDRTGEAATCPSNPTDPEAAPAD
jgi:hypothetical protein